MASVKRLSPSTSFATLIDYQSFFLEQLDEPVRARLSANTKNFVRLIGYFRIPLVATVERPVEHKGGVPEAISAQFGTHAKIFEKDFFDLTKEKPIRDHLARHKKKQVIVAGCETDVCVLQSCLGLIGLGHAVFAVEELLFSSARDTTAAAARLKAAGVTFVSYKTLFYELIEAVEGGRHVETMLKTFGPFPDDLPDVAVE